MTRSNAFPFFLVLCTALALADPAHAALAYHWIGGGGNSFPAPGNWNPPRVSPAPDDILVFSLQDTMPIFGVPTQTVGKIRVLDGQLALHGNPGTVLTITGGAAGLEVAAGQKLVLEGTDAITLSCATGTTGTVSGTVIVRGSGHRILSADAGALAIESGGVVSTETNFSGNLFGSAAPAGVNSVRFKAGSLYVSGAGANPFGFAAPQSAVVFEPGSRFRLDAGAPAASGRTYADFELNVPGSSTMTGAGLVTMDSLLLTRGSLSIQNNSARFNGAIRLAPGTTLALAPATAATYVLGGSSPQWIKSIGDSGPFTASTNVTLQINNPFDVYADSVDFRGGASLQFVQGRLILPDAVPGALHGTLILNANATITGAGPTTGWIVGRVGIRATPAFPNVLYPVGDAHYAPVSLNFHGLGLTTVPLCSTFGFDHPGVELAQLDRGKMIHRFWTASFGSTAYTSVDVLMNWDAADADPGIDASKFAVRRIRNQFYQRSPLLEVTPTSAQTSVPYPFTPVAWNFAAGESAVVRVDAARVSALESAGGIGIPVELSQASIDTVIVQFTTVDSTATTADGDYTSTSGTIIIPPQDTTRTVSVPIGDNSINEADESFLLTFPSVLNAVARDRGEGVILNDDPNQAPSMTVVSPSAGNHYVVGTHVNIVWNSNDDLGVTSVDLFLSRTGGDDYEVLATGLPNTHNYDWVVTGPVTNRGVIKGVAHDGGGLETADESNGIFYIDDVVGVPQPVLPTAFALQMLGSNPLYGEARFSLALPRASRVELSIVDVRGRHVATLAQGSFEAGVHDLSWDSRRAAAGIYFVRLEAEGFSARDRLVLLR